MDKDKEISFVKKYILSDFDFEKTYNEFKEKHPNVFENYSFENAIDDTLNYCFYSEFNPYLDKKYLDYTWLYNKDTNLIYNIDDIFDVFYYDLEDYVKEVVEND